MVKMHDVLDPSGERVTIPNDGNVTMQLLAAAWQHKKLAPAHLCWKGAATYQAQEYRPFSYIETCFFWNFLVIPFWKPLETSRTFWILLDYSRSFLILLLHSGPRPKALWYMHKSSPSYNIITSAPPVLYILAAIRQALERRHPQWNHCTFVMEGKHNFVIS